VVLAFGTGRRGIEWSASLDSRLNFWVGGATTSDWTVGIKLFAAFVLLTWLLYTTKEQDGEG